MIVTQRAEIARLRSAIDSCRLIGAATGIVMHAYDLTFDRAFEALIATSTKRTDSLQDVAAEVVLTCDADSVERPGR